MRVDGRHYTITKIEVIQNKFLWTTFKSGVEQTIQMTGIEDIQHLYHGTRTTDPQKIIDGYVGFDSTHADYGMWGKGNYFAKNAVYSHNYANN